MESKAAATLRRDLWATFGPDEFEHLGYLVTIQLDHSVRMVTLCFVENGWGWGCRKEKPMKKLLNPNARLRSKLRLIGLGIGGRGMMMLRVTPRFLA